MIETLHSAWLTFSAVKAQATLAWTYTSFPKYYSLELSVSHIFLSNGFLFKTLFHPSVAASDETFIP